MRREPARSSCTWTSSNGPAVFVSMELSAVDLGGRLVSVLTNSTKDHLVVGRLTDEQQGQVHLDRQVQAR